ERLKQRRNQVNEEISRLKKGGGDAAPLIAEGKGLAERIQAFDPRLAEIEGALEAFLMRLPNLPSERTPVGRDAGDNVGVRTWGERRCFSCAPRSHGEIGEALGILDFRRAAQLAGARFSVLLGAGARMERALIQFMLDIQTREHGYREVAPPFMVNTRTMTGTGQ